MVTNEVKKVELTNGDGFPRRYVVASNVAIDKGTFLILSSPRTAAANSTQYAACAGISSMDKAADDYSTSITAWTDGVFQCIASGSITAGKPVALASQGVVNNYVVQASIALASGAAVIGYALSDASDEGTFDVRVRL